MRIFIIPSVFPSENNPVSGAYVKDQCMALSEMGHEIIVLYVETKRYNRWLENDYNTITKNSIEDVKVYHSKYRGMLSSKLPKFAIKYYNKKLQLLYNEAVKDIGRPDLLHAHFTFTSGIGANMLNKISGIPFIVTEHSSLFLSSKINYRIKINLLETMNNSTAFMCVSQHLKRSINNFVIANKRIDIIENMLDDRFKFFPTIKKNDFVFFSAGNLVKSKNFMMLIESFCQEFDKYESVKLIIGGDGPEKNKLLKKIARLDRENQILILGRLNRDSMLENYQNCNCFILLSQYETFGIVYREALAVGRPVISSKNGGIEEGWENDFGILLKKNDVINCRIAMRSVLKNKIHFDYKYISDRTRKKYSKESFLSKMNLILARINSQYS